MQSQDTKQLMGQQPSRIRHTPKPQGKVSMPSGLPKAAKAFWKKYVPVIESMGVLTKADEPMLIELCITYAQLQQAIDAYAQQEVGTIQSTRLWNIVAAARASLGKQSAKFGLTPVDRNSLSVNSESDTEQDRKFFG